MPNLGEFRINENILAEVLRVKENEGYKHLPPKIPNKVVTTYPTEVLTQTEWFDHLHNTKVIF
jgi:hypothetical protein